MGPDFENGVEVTVEGQGRLEDADELVQHDVGLELSEEREGAGQRIAHPHGAGRGGAPEVVLQQGKGALRRRGARRGIKRQREAAGLVALGAHPARHLLVELLLDERHEGLGEAPQHRARILGAGNVGEEGDRNLEVGLAFSHGGCEQLLLGRGVA